MHPLKDGASGLTSIKIFDIMVVAIQSMFREKSLRLRG